MTDECELKKLQDDQRRLAGLLMAVKVRHEFGGDVIISVNDADFLMRLAHEAIKYRNLAKEREDE
jgi:hypothetical protein